MSFWSQAASMASSMQQPLTHSSISGSRTISFPYFSTLSITTQMTHKMIRTRRSLILCSSDPTASTNAVTKMSTGPSPLVKKKRHRYRKQYPGESKGITEEMRFVAMRLRNLKGTYTHKSRRKKTSNDEDDEEEEEDEGENNLSAGSDVDGDDGEGEGDGETWQPSMEGFLKYLVDSKLVFSTVERIVDESDDVSYAYFRRTGLERSEGLSKDLEWFTQQDIVIPEPSNPGISYAKYLEELAEKSAPLFLSHFYNIYFSHIAGGQVIAKQVSEKLLDGRGLEFYRWEGDVPELLKGVREKLNMLGEHWARDDKNKCLKEATKSFSYMGQIVRLIIL